MCKLTSILLFFAMCTFAAVKIEKTSYAGWPNCYRISNGEVELIVTSDIGPRIMRYGFAGGQNMLKEFADMLGKSGESSWQSRGGHRLWVGPESMPMTYALDNGPVKIEVDGDILEAIQPVEKETGLQKSMVIKLAGSGTRVEVLHRIRNTTLFPVEFAPWALTMMAPGGLGITGFPPRGKHPEMLAPTNPLVMWAYTDLSDKRWRFSSKYMGLQQDPNNASPQKLGHFNANTWGAYLLGSDLYIKRSKADETKTYPDFGCSFETFTNNEFLELETLGPMTRVEPNGTVEHTEHWSLHRNVPIPRWDDATLDAVLLPLLK